MTKTMAENSNIPRNYIDLEPKFIYDKLMSLGMCLYILVCVHAYKIY